MYTPEQQGRGGVALAAATPGSAGDGYLAIQQRLSELPPPQRKRGRPTKAEIEARRERERLELLAAQRIHGGDLPSDFQNSPARVGPKQEGGLQQKQIGQKQEGGHLQQDADQDQGQGHEDAEDDESEDAAGDSPDTED